MDSLRSRLKRKSTGHAKKRAEVQTEEVASHGAQWGVMGILPAMLRNARSAEDACELKHVERVVLVEHIGLQVTFAQGQRKSRHCDNVGGRLEDLSTLITHPHRIRDKKDANERFRTVRECAPGLCFARRSGRLRAASTGSR